MKHDDVYRNARFGGSVKRYHTWPSLTTQTVGEHTWQLFRIYWFIWGSPRPAVTEALIWHDAPELFAGDGAYPAKRKFPALKHALDQAEAYGRVMMGGPNNPEQDLSLIEVTRIKLCDNMDMLEHGLVEYGMGNRFMLPIIQVTYEAVIQLKIKLPELEAVRVERYLAQVRHSAGQYGISEALPIAYSPAPSQPLDVQPAE